MSLIFPNFHKPTFCKSELLNALSYNEKMQFYIMILFSDTLCS